MVYSTPSHSHSSLSSHLSPSTPPGGGAEEGGGMGLGLVELDRDTELLGEAGVTGVGVAGLGDLTPQCSASSKSDSR